jgi:two-component system, NarL family, nitrate/nitrite response regulator NarL
MVRILIADDYDVVRAGLKSVLAQQDDWTVCGEATNGLEAISKTAELQPDLLILDISMPVMSGIQAAIQIRQIAPATKILVLSSHDTSLTKHVLSSSGAHAFVSKAVVNSELIQTISQLLTERRVHAEKTGATENTLASAQKPEPAIPKSGSRGHSNPAQ